jgi:hypothetical protein
VLRVAPWKTTYDAALQKRNNLSLHLLTLSSQEFRDISLKVYRPNEKPMFLRVPTLVSSRAIQRKNR